MILVDTGPLVALLDPQDDAHQRCRAALHGVHEPLVSTVPVPTEAFHLLGPARHGARALQQFVAQRGLSTWFMDDPALIRGFELMRRYEDHPMDLADASLVVAAETLRVSVVFTVDRQDFATYRARIGRSWRRFETLP